MMRRENERIGPTAKAVIRDLEGDGGIWLDRDGDRLRMIVRPPTSAPDLESQVEQAARLLQVDIRVDPELEQGNDSTAE
jgi:hypothetical protein